MRPGEVSLRDVIILRIKVNKELEKMEKKEFNHMGTVTGRSYSNAPNVSSTPRGTGPCINYGDANGWKETPELIVKCPHQPTRRKISNCYFQYTCEECGYTYKVDSGG